METQTFYKYIIVYIYIYIYIYIYTYIIMKKEDKKKLSHVVVLFCKCCKYHQYH